MKNNGEKKEKDRDKEKKKSQLKEFIIGPTLARCGVCNQSLKKNIVQVGENRYHRECLKCFQCQMKITGEVFNLNERRYCKNCIEDVLQKRKQKQQKKRDNTKEASVDEAPVQAILSSLSQNQTPLNRENAGTLSKALSSSSSTTTQLALSALLRVSFIASNHPLIIETEMVQNACKLFQKFTENEPQAIQSLLWGLDNLISTGNRDLQILLLENGTLSTVISFLSSKTPAIQKHAFSLLYSATLKNDTTRDFLLKGENFKKINEAGHQPLKDEVKIPSLWLFSRLRPQDPFVLDSTVALLDSNIVDQVNESTIILTNLMIKDQTNVEKILDRRLVDKLYKILSSLQTEKETLRKAGQLLANVSHEPKAREQLRKQSSLLKTLMSLTNTTTDQSLLSSLLLILGNLAVDSSDTELDGFQFPLLVSKLKEPIPTVHKTLLWTLASLLNHDALQKKFLDDGGLVLVLRTLENSTQSLEPEEHLELEVNAFLLFKRLSVVDRGRTELLKRKVIPYIVEFFESSKSLNESNHTSAIETLGNLAVDGTCLSAVVKSGGISQLLRGAATPSLAHAAVTALINYSMNEESRRKLVKGDRFLRSTEDLPSSSDPKLVFKYLRLITNLAISNEARKKLQIWGVVEIVQPLMNNHPSPFVRTQATSCLVNLSFACFDFPEPFKKKKNHKSASKSVRGSKTTREEEKTNEIINNMSDSQKLRLVALRKIITLLESSIADLFVLSKNYCETLGKSEIVSEEKLRGMFSIADVTKNIHLVVAHLLSTSCSVWVSADVVAPFFQQLVVVKSWLEEYIAKCDSYMLRLVDAEAKSNIAFQQFLQTAETENSKKIEDYFHSPIANLRTLVEELRALHELTPKDHPDRQALASIVADLSSFEPTDLR